MPTPAPGHRHARRTAAAFAALALTTAGLAATAAPAAAAPATTTLSISPFRAERRAGSSITYTFTLYTADKRLSGKTITIYTRPSTSVGWTKLTTRTTNTNGQTAASWTVRRSQYTKATFAGDSLHAADSSAAAHVSVPAPALTFGQKVVQEASRHVGKPYQWGASGPNRFDCSGYTMYVFNRFGRSLPHNSRMQYSAVRKVAKADKRVGDLIFTYDSGGIHHVSIYAGNGYIWHSPRSGSYVHKKKMWSSSYYVGRVA